MRRRILFGTFILLVAGGIAIMSSSSWLKSFGARPAGQRLERIQRSPHYHDGQFINTVPTNLMAPGSFWTMLRHQWFGKEERTPRRSIPVMHQTGSRYAIEPASHLRATWIGHATALVEIDGRRVVTDPIWSERCSPSTWIGPKRFHPPPITLDELPKVDVAVISHDHYDHLDMATVQALAVKGTQFVVPLGVGAHLEAWDIPVTQIVELDWDETASVADLKFTATPARHYSGRNPLYRNNTEWASWVVRGPTHSFFFSGDSGYFPGFKAIGDEYGPFDLSLVKIGACDVTWPDIHMTPEEAVQVHQDIRGKLLLPVHWGTFNLAFHAWNDPAERVVIAAAHAGATLFVPRPGELVEPELLMDPNRRIPLDAWWR